MKIFFLLSCISLLFSQDIRLTFKSEYLNNNSYAYYKNGEKTNDKSDFSNLEPLLNSFSLAYVHRITEKTDIGLTFNYGRSKTKEQDLSVFGYSGVEKALPYHFFGGSFLLDHYITSPLGKYAFFISLNTGLNFFEGEVLELDGGSMPVANDYTQSFAAIYLGMTYKLINEIKLHLELGIFGYEKDSYNHKVIDHDSYREFFGFNLKRFQLAFSYHL